MSRPQTIINRPSSSRPSAKADKPISVGSPRRTLSEITDGIHRPGNIYVKQTTYSGSQKLFSPRRGFRIPLIAIAAVILVVVAILVVNATGACSQRSEKGAVGQFTTTMEGDISYTLSAPSLQSLPDTDEVSPASLASGDSFSIASGMLARINSAISPIEQTADCGFVFMDVRTGRALVYHAGKTLYCASAAKAPLAYYALGKAAGDDSLPAGDLYGFDNLWEALEAALVESDNDAYFAICDTYFTDEYLQWLASYGVTASGGTTTRAVSGNADDEEHDEGDYESDWDDGGYEGDEDYNGERGSQTFDDYFPKMSARSLCAIWASLYQYVKAGSEDAQRLAGLFGATEESYIRSALSGSGATVLDKAGWMADEDTKSVSDAGIVSIGGRDYLMAIITEQSEQSAEARANVENLAQALFDARGMLAPHVVVSS